MIGSSASALGHSVGLTEGVSSLLSACLVRHGHLVCRTKHGRVLFECVLRCLARVFWLGVVSRGGGVVCSVFTHLDAHLGRPLGLALTRLLSHNRLRSAFF